MLVRRNSTIGQAYFLLSKLPYSSSEPKALLHSLFFAKVTPRTSKSKREGYVSKLSLSAAKTESSYTKAPSPETRLQVLLSKCYPLGSVFEPARVSRNSRIEHVNSVRSL
jgi:hypothetical protein